MLESAWLEWYGCWVDNGEHRSIVKLLESNIEIFDCGVIQVETIYEYSEHE